jgi:uncharacterized protein (DUF2147 family)
MGHAILAQGASDWPAPSDALELGFYREMKGALSLAGLSVNCCPVRPVDRVPGGVSKMKIATIVTAAALLSVSSPPAQAAPPSGESHVGADRLETSYAADTLVGNWWTEGKEGKMKIEKTKSGRYQVILLGGKEEDKKDVNNPDPKLRERKLKGIVIMWNLKFEDGEYVDGYCYNPRDGNTYRVKMKITGKNSLRIRGYLLVPLLGQSQDWARQV